VSFDAYVKKRSVPFGAYVQKRSVPFGAYVQKRSVPFGAYVQKRLFPKHGDESVRCHQPQIIYREPKASYALHPSA